MEARARGDGPTEEQRGAGTGTGDSQIRVHTRDTRFGDRLRQSGKPTFWLPLQSIFSPQCFVPVDCSDLDQDGSAFGKCDLVEQLAVTA